MGLKKDSWWEEFKSSGWFDRILLLFPYLLGLAVVIMFMNEWLKTGYL